MPTTTTAKKSLFDLAKKAPATAAKKATHDVITASDEIMSANIIRYNELKDYIKEAEAEKAMIEGQLKPAFKEIFMQQYQIQKRRPESFKMQSIPNERGAKSDFLVMVIDKYIKVDDSKIEYMTANNFQDVLETTTEYSFNPEILARAQEQISDAIMAADLSDEDKANLLVVKSVTAIKKGTIDRLLQYDNPELLFNVIEPIMMLK